MLKLGNCGKVIQASLPQEHNNVTRFGIFEWLLYVTCTSSDFQQCRSILSLKVHSQLLEWEDRRVSIKNVFCFVLIYRIVNT